VREKGGKNERKERENGVGEERASASARAMAKEVAGCSAINTCLCSKLRYTLKKTCLPLYDSLYAFEIGIIVP